MAVYTGNVVYIYYLFMVAFPELSIGLGSWKYTSAVVRSRRASALMWLGQATSNVGACISKRSGIKRVHKPSSEHVLEEKMIPVPDTLWRKPRQKIRRIVKWFSGLFFYIVKSLRVPGGLKKPRRHRREHAALNSVDFILILFLFLIAPSHPNY